MFMGQHQPLLAPSREAARFPLLPFPPPKSKHSPIAVDSAASPDPSNPSCPTPLPTAPFSSSAIFLGPLKPRRAGGGLALGPVGHDENLASSSSSPVSSSITAGAKATRGNGPVSLRKRSVKFSSTHLDSLQSSPRHSSPHAFLPASHPERPVYSAARLFPLALEPFAPSQTRPVASPPSPRDAADDGEESPTDDEEDEATVLQLLLSSPSSSQSPSRPRTLPARCPPPPAPFAFTPLGLTHPHASRHPQSILKRSKHPILKVASAVEGCRRNGGRRRHALGWLDADAAAVGIEVNTAKGTTGTSNGAAGRPGGPKRWKQDTRTSASTTEVSSSGTGGVGGNGGGQGAGGDEGDDRPEQPPPSIGLPSANPSKRVDYPADDDPIHLRVPLLTLRQSLQSFLSPRQAPQPTTSDLPSGLLPRTSPPTDKSSPLHLSMRGANLCAIALATDSAMEVDDDTTSSSPFLPIMLPEIELAYARLVRALIRLPTPLADASRTLAPLREYRASLLRSLDRDISNVVSFPASIAMTSRARGLLGERRDTASGSASGSESGSSSPLKHEEGKRSKKGLSEEEMRRQKDEGAVAQVAIKVVAALAQDSRLYSLFSDGELGELVAKIIAIPGSASLSSSVQKDVYPFVSWFLSVQRLPPPLISTHIFRIATSLRTTLATVDKPRNNLSEGISAVTQLISTHPHSLLPHWRSWFRPIVEGLWEVPKKGNVVKLKAVKALGAIVGALTRPSVGEDDEKRAAREKAADDMSEELLAALYRKTPDKQTALSRLVTELEACLKTDEAIWAVHVIALLPALLGKRFRKLEPRGVRPWITLVTACRAHTSQDVKVLSSLLWNHLAYAFTSTPLDDGSMWVFRADCKPFNLLVQVFTQSSGPKMDHAHALVLAGVIYGLSILNLALPPASTSIVGAAPADPQLENLDFVWEKVVTAALPQALASSNAQTASVGWAILAAMVKPPSTDTERRPILNALVNPVFLDGVPPVKSKMPVLPGVLASRAIESTCSPDAIPGWASRWTVSRIQRVLELAEKGMGLEEGKTGISCATLDPGVFVFWAKLLRAIKSESNTESVIESVLDWLLSHFSAAPSVIARFAGTTFDVLSDELADMSTSEGQIRGLVFAMLASPEAILPSPESEARAFVALAGLMLAQLPFIQNTIDLLDVLTPNALLAPTELYSGLLDAAASKWAGVLDSIADRIAASQLETVIALVTAHAASKVGVDPELWATLARSVASVVLDDAAPPILIGAFRAHFNPPANSVEGLHLLAFLVSTSNGVGDFASDRLLACLDDTLATFDDTTGPPFEVITHLLVSFPDALFVPAFVQVLERVRIITTPTSAQLERLTPFLIQHLTRAFDLHTPDSQHTATLSQSILAAFCEFWRATFAFPAEDLDITVELAEILSIVRGVADDFEAVNLGETQALGGESARGRADSAPPAGQVAPSAAAAPTLTAAFDVSAKSGLGYDADVSHMPESSDEYSLLNAHRYSGSPSLRVPTASRSEEVPASTQVDETPPQVLKTRSRSSLALLASGASLDGPVEHAESSREGRSSKRTRGLSPSAKLPAQSLSKLPTQSPSQSQSQAKSQLSRRSSRRTSKPVYESASSDEERVVVTRRSSCQSQKRSRPSDSSKAVDSPAAKRAKAQTERSPPAQSTSAASVRRRSSGMLYPVVEIEVRRSSKRPSASPLAASPPKRLRTEPEEKPDDNDSAMGDLTDAPSGSEADDTAADVAVVPALPAEAKDAIRQFLAHTLDLSPALMLEEVSAIGGAQGVAHFLGIAEWAKRAEASS